jgi:formylglycine-generating enzyme required for sulfatase activity
MKTNNFILAAILLLSGIATANAANSVVKGVADFPNAAAFNTFVDSTLPAGDTLKLKVGRYVFSDEITIPAGKIVVGGYDASGNNRIYPGAAMNFADITYLDGNSLNQTLPADKHRVATVNGNLEGCVIVNGHVRRKAGSLNQEGYGGGVLINSTGKVSHCIIKGNVAMHVPAMPLTDAADADAIANNTLTDYVYKDANAGKGGGVYLNGGTLANSVVAWNMANDGYGVAGNGTLVNNTVTANTWAPLPVFVPRGVYKHYKPSEAYRADGVYELDGPLITIRSFYLGQTEITTAQYAVFANAMDLSQGIVDTQITFFTSLNLGALTDPFATFLNGSTTTVTSYMGTIAATSGLFYLSGTATYPWGLRRLGRDFTWWQSAPAGSGINEHIENEAMCYVSWYGSLAFSLWIGGSLPTEAQWEFAARRTADKTGTDATFTNMLYAGTNVANATGYAWTTGYPGTSNENVHEVATASPNAIGLYDMSGNVDEWCADCGIYDTGTTLYSVQYPDLEIANPIWTSGSYRVIRGGQWISPTYTSSLANRGSTGPGNAGPADGFRPVLVP